MLFSLDRAHPQPQHADTARRRPRSQRHWLAPRKLAHPLAIRGAYMEGSQTDAA